MKFVRNSIQFGWDYTMANIVGLLPFSILLLISIGVGAYYPALQVVQTILTIGFVGLALACTKHLPPSWDAFMNGLKKIIPIIGGYLLLVLGILLFAGASIAPAYLLSRILPPEIAPAILGLLGLFALIYIFHEDLSYILPFLHAKRRHDWIRTKMARIAIFVALITSIIVGILLFANESVQQNESVFFQSLILFIVPICFLAFRFTFFVYAIIDRDASIFESFEISWDLTYGRLWQLISLIFLTSIIFVLGLLVFIVGGLVSIPVQQLSLAKFYRYLLEDKKMDVVVEHPQNH